MKATREEQQALLTLAEIDREAGKLNYALSALPIYSELEAAEAALSSHAKRARETADRRPHIETIINDCGARVEQLSATINRKQGQLESGENMDSRQLIVLQGEIDGLKESRETIELEELEAMERLDALESEIESDALELSRLASVRDDLSGRRDRDVASLQSQIDEVRSRRDALARRIPSDILDAYEESRSMGGSGVVVMREDGSVDGGMDLSMIEIERVKALPADQVYVTEDTGAVVIRG